VQTLVRQQVDICHPLAVFPGQKCFDCLRVLRNKYLSYFFAHFKCALTDSRAEPSQ
jgi:hypothetical protein